ncbi:MAG TPA: hypothetical protein VLI90_19215, partial [Tepidisphaeraceae bacterium]|nr:hypothetical protein [Tepidisphaeraceae bacterium]
MKLDWLDRSPPATTQPLSWGVPWPQGQVKKDATFALSGGDGHGLPLQSWPLAYWPDGSLKWTAHATVVPGGENGLSISVSPAAAAATSLHVESVGDDIAIDTGPMVCHLAKNGPSLIKSIALGDKIVARNGRLLCSIDAASGEESFTSQIDNVIVEQTGPVRAVVKFTGKHKSTTGDRSWLPFVVRLYFYAGDDSIRMVHTFIFDGDQDKDFIRSLGVRFAVPMREQIHNRHVRFAGETGMFAEPVQLIAGRRNRRPDLYRQQVAGQRVPNLDQLPDADLVKDMAVWDRYRLTQISADSYQIQKNTNDQSAWINASAANRSLGLAFVGDVSGGLAVGLKNFWQLAPTELEIIGASTDAAQLTLWLWSPQSPRMDLRHYDTKAHGLEASYEDVQPGFSTATGIARTSEITIHPFNNVPSNERLLAVAKSNAQPPMLVCTPEYFHSLPVFGLWSLPDRSSPGKRWIENELDKAIAFYQGQIEQRRWYGFWDFGDVMHTYDTTRHEWRYDIGGFAWANTELMPNLWLWYSFLRSGRADVYRMAEAMTRQTQEVSVYHLGRFAGLGSRHNVRHWGDGAKELRISQALLKRFYYYLSTDERTGELMNEVIDADAKLVDVDPMREIVGKSQYPTHMRVGPDWFAAVSNWYTAWERTGDAKYRDKILAGMKSIVAMPKKIFAGGITNVAGGTFGYDPKTGKLYQLADKADVPPLAALFGGPELNFEIVPVLNDADWAQAWLQYCELLNAPRAEQEKVLGNAINSGRSADFSRMAAYAAYVKHDPQLAARAWQQFLHAGNLGGAAPGTEAPLDPFDVHKINGPQAPTPVDEIR